jgi:hypothetical protein
LYWRHLPISPFNSICIRGIPHDSQINELSKGEKANSSPNKYNLWSKKKEGKSDIPDQPSIAEKPAKDATNNNKEKKAQNPPPIAKDPCPRGERNSEAPFLF